MLKPELQNNEIRENTDDQTSGIDEVISTENQEMQKIVNNNEQNVNENDEAEDEPKIEVRRSNRKRCQRINIQPDEIGNCDDENDQDYKQRLK